MSVLQERRHISHHHAGALGALVDWLEVHLHLRSRSGVKKATFRPGKIRKKYANEKFFRDSGELDAYMKDLMSS